MGAWGYEILENDGSLDIYEAYLEMFNRGNSPEAIRQELETSRVDFHRDASDGHLFWLGLALAQWECGALQPDVLERVEEIVVQGTDVSQWDIDGAKRRQKVLNKFVKKLRTSSTKPGKARKPPGKRRPLPAIYRPGDCLSLRLSDGHYGAAIVLAGEDFADEDGANFLCLLHYHKLEPPTLAEFEKRNWLRSTHHHGRGELETVWCPSRTHKKVASSLEWIGRVDLRPDDPQPSKIGVGFDSSWSFGQRMVWQHEWDQGIRNWN